MSLLRIAVLSLALFAPLLPAAAAEAAAGRVSFLAGEVHRTPASGGTVPLVLDATVEQGDTIRTAAGGRVELALEDGSVLRLNERSQLVLEELGQDRESKTWAMRMRVALGALWAKVAPRDGGAPRFEVETERMVAGVRGTQFIVQAGEEHAVVVLEGAVEVAGQGGRVLGDRASHALPQQTAIVVDREGRTEGVVGIGGRHDFNAIIEWVRKFDRGGGEGEHGDGARREGTWKERRDERRRLHRDERRDRRIFGR